MVEAAQRKGKRVTVISTVKSKPPMVADELRRQSDYFLELQDLKEIIGRKGDHGDHPAHPIHDDIDDDIITLHDDDDEDEYFGNA